MENLFRYFTIILCVLAIFVIGVFIYGTYKDPIKNLYSSVVAVNTASGVVVYSNDNSALVLTSLHVVGADIFSTMCSGCYYETEVGIPGYDDMELFKPLSIEFDALNDLALILVKTNRKMPYVNIGNRILTAGDDIYTVSNPQGLFRSLKKGVISAKNRIKGNSFVNEISGGAIFGSSGGGVFSSAGELIGIICSVRMLETPYCSENGECITIPLPFIGFATTNVAIVNFVKRSSFSDRLYYLR